MAYRSQGACDLQISKSLAFYQGHHNEAIGWEEGRNIPELTAEVCPETERAAGTSRIPLFTRFARAEPPLRTMPGGGAGTPASSVLCHAVSRTMSKEHNAMKGPRSVSLGQRKPFSVT
jgi:hypothetical protein